MSTDSLIGVDIGGTGIKAVRLRDGAVVGELRRPTPAGDATGARTADVVTGMVETLAGLDSGDRPAIGVVVPGVVDEGARRAVRAVNLGWHDVPIAELLDARLGRPIAFGQDVRAGALAELRDAVPAGIGAFVPIGTGLAVALTRDGVPLAGDGWTGEIGRLPIRSGAFAGAALEDIASARAIAARAGLADARAVADAVRRGDPHAVEVWTTSLDVLAEAAAWITAIAAPRRIVVGGGLALAGDLLLDGLGRALDASLGELPRPRLELARHGDLAGAIGAALLAATGARS